MRENIQIGDEIMTIGGIVGIVVKKSEDTVVIETAIAGYNGIKLSVRYRMTDKETGELRTIAASEHCFLNRSGKPISLKRSYPEIDTKFFQMMDEES